MTTDQLRIDAALASRRQAAAQASATFNSLTDDQFQRAVAPGTRDSIGCSSKTPTGSSRSCRPRQT
jgi:hypothetical protein